MRSDYLIGTAPHGVHFHLADRQLADALVDGACDVPDGLWLVRRQLEGVEHFALLAKAEDILDIKPDWHYLCAGPNEGRNAFLVFTITHDHQGLQQVLMIGSFDSFADAVDAYNEPLLLYGIPPVDPALLHHELIERVIASQRTTCAHAGRARQRRRY